ncbi:MAG: hypothetical protein KF819_36310 [Labilithrix sp.]|nr:hypothetical protein [Labilithrix sp.]
MVPTPALDPESFLRSVVASRATLGLSPMKLLDIVSHVTALTDGAPYAIVGGLAQILWARKTHTDDLDIALSSASLLAAYDRVTSGRAERGWALPSPPDRAHEANDVFEVYHLLFDGAVVDLLSFRTATFNEEILSTAVSVPALGNLRFVRPELLLVTQLLRPGPRAAVAAIDLVVARGELDGGLDVDYTRAWARAVGREAGLDRALSVAAALRSSS